MIRIGEMNTLPVLRLHAVGAFLGEPEQEVLLPISGSKVSLHTGESVSVFVFKDIDGQLTATLHQPKAVVGEVAWLNVVAVNKVGAFLDWGLPKDLLCPYGEQHQTMEVGKNYLVMIFLDDNDRIAASARINEFLEDENAEKFSVGQTVSLIIADKTPLGVKAVIENSHWGVLYENELFNKVRKGQKITGYIKKIRDDGRIDLSLQKPGAKREQVISLADNIVDQVNRHQGFLPMNDKTPPEQIYSMFGVSKKTFKQALGGLYKQRRILIEDSGIRLVK